jgi:CTP synthase (UTP-ammonia lyase)
MSKIIRVGIIGDFDPLKVSHPATNDAILHAAKSLSIETDITWISTPSMLTQEGQQQLKEADCIWASSGSPYASMDGMIKGIQIARELNRPFIGT